ncbi:hypothetical protein [Paludibacterium yongneupense]|uniref:hypothetical protein n=1 Tax=Paludibacterium yongneupense TaxID=400061 RepID=UPI0003FF11C1|nr:hypothetical protein [Paludibacterium yongneupense]
MFFEIDLIGKTARRAVFSCYRDACGGGIEQRMGFWRRCGMGLKKVHMGYVPLKQ